MAQKTDVDVSLEYDDDDVEDDDSETLPDADEDYMDDPDIEDEKRERKY